MTNAYSYSSFFLDFLTSSQIEILILSMISGKFVGLNVFL